MLNSQTGWAVGATASTDDGVIIKTIDGGNTWDLTYTKDFLTSGYFIDAAHGWITGVIKFNGSSIVTVGRTLDGGNTWEYPLESIPMEVFRLYDVHFTDSMHGWAVGRGIPNAGGIIIETTDGGKTWSYPMYINNTFRFYSVHFIDDRTGWASGEGDSGGCILKYAPLVY